MPGNHNPVYDFVADFLAPTNGTSDSQPAAVSFRNQARTDTGLITLNCPGSPTVSGGVYNWMAADPETGGAMQIVKGIQAANASVLVQGVPSCIFQGSNDVNAPSFNLGANGSFNPPQFVGDVEYAYLANASAGTNTLALLDASAAALITTNRYYVIGCYDMQGLYHFGGFGFPPNNHFFEWVFVTTKTGNVLTLRDPLKNSYKQSYPLLDDGTKFLAQFTAQIVANQMTISAVTFGTVSVGMSIADSSNEGPGQSSWVNVQPGTTITASDNVFTGSISGSVLTVTGIASGQVSVGHKLTGSGIVQGGPNNDFPVIASLGTGSGGAGTYNLDWSAGPVVSAMITGTGGVGLYTVGVNHSVSSETMYGLGGPGAHEGGPALLWIGDASWDLVVEWKNIHFIQQAQILARGRDVSFTLCRFSGQFGGTSDLAPSDQQKLRTTSCTFDDVVEVDKIIGNWFDNGSTYNFLVFQSSSTDVFSTEGSSFVQLQGTPKRVIAESCTFTGYNDGVDHPGLLLGAAGQGRTDEGIFTNCTFTRGLLGGGLKIIGGADQGVNVAWTMAAGIIKIPITMFTNSPNLNQARWAVPGTWCMFTGEFDNEGSFQVLDVWQDANFVYIQTSLTGGFPPVPLDGSGRLTIRVHPCPKLTLQNCTGVGALQGHPAGRPIYEWNQYEFDGSTADPAHPQFAFFPWGKLKKITFNIRQKYTGTSPSLSFLLAQSNNLPILLPDGSTTTYAASVDCRQGPRQVVVTPQGVSGAIGSDSVGLFPTDGWFMGQTQSGSAFTADVTGESSAVRPDILVTIETDQGIVSSPAPGARRKYVSFAMN